MHMMFTQEEVSWIDTKKFGWPIKQGCPEKIRKSIEGKRKKIDNQFAGGVADGHKHK